MTADRIKHDPDGRLDEFVLHDLASVHFEAMGDAQFWMLLRMADGRELHVNCGAVNAQARGYARIEEDA